MWESRRDFQRVWEGWEAGFMAFHAFHTLSFPWSAFRPPRLDKPRRHPAQCAAAARKCLSLSTSALAIVRSYKELRLDSFWMADDSHRWFMNPQGRNASRQGLELYRKRRLETRRRCDVLW